MAVGSSSRAGNCVPLRQRKHSPCSIFKFIVGKGTGIYLHLKINNMIILSEILKHYNIKQHLLKEHL